MVLNVQCLADRPDLRASADDIGPLVWPAFMFWDPTGELYFSHIEQYAEFVMVLEDDAAPGVALARACSVPFAMDIDGEGRSELPGDGWDGVLRWADADRQSGRRATTVSALEITIRPARQGTGISQIMIEALRVNARRLGFGDLVAPVRPNLKPLEPLTPIREYAQRDAQTVCRPTGGCGSTPVWAPRWSGSPLPR